MSDAASKDSMLSSRVSRFRIRIPIIWNPDSYGSIRDWRTSWSLIPKSWIPDYGFPSFWNLDFAADYLSNGGFKVTIPK